MSIFITSDEQKVKVYEIAAQMKKMGLSVHFISACVQHALENEGTHDLMILWLEAESEVERNEVIADIQDEIDAMAEAPKTPTKKPYIKFDDLDAIAKDVMKFKKSTKKGC